MPEKIRKDRNETKGILFECLHCGRVFKGIQGANNHRRALGIDDNARIMRLLQW